MNEVDPRFSRWFMRNAVLFAKEYEKKEKKERWIAVKNFFMPSISRLVTLVKFLLWICLHICRIILYIIDKAPNVFLLIGCFYMFVILLLFLRIFIVLPCTYLKNDTYRDICPTSGFNITSKIYIFPEEVQFFHGTMYFIADVVIPTCICDLINSYHIM